MKRIPSLAAVLILALNTGCVSYLAWDHTAQEMANARSRRAIQMGASPGEAYLAVDITAWDYIRENPGLVLGAALTDGALLYGAYWLTQEINDQNESGDRSSVNVTAGGDAQVTVSGNDAASENDQGNRPTTTTTETTSGGVP